MDWGLNMKRFFTSVLCLTLLASLLAGPVLAVNDMANPEITNAFSRFSDVASGAWYESGVYVVSAYGLVKGVSDDSFGTGTNLKLSEAVTLAARLHCIYNSGSASFSDTEPWYQTYADYAVENSIISARQFENYEAMATRLQFVELMAAALPDEVFPEINSIETGVIADVSPDVPNTSVYKLYRAGVLTGKTEDGHFYPTDPVFREEAAVIVARIADPSLRETFFLQAGLGFGDFELSGKIHLAFMSSLNATGNCRMARSDPSINYGKPLYTVNVMVPRISKSLMEAIDYVEGRPELKEVSKYLEAARLISEEISRIVPALGASSSSDEWDTAIKLFQDCTDALRNAKNAL